MQSRPRRSPLRLAASLSIGLCIGLPTAACTRTPSAPASAAPASIELMAKSDIEPNIELQRYRTKGADGVERNVLLYVPRGAPEPLPLVVIAPAGSSLMTGMSWSGGDVREEVPYARGLCGRLVRHRRPAAAGRASQRD